MRKLKLPMLLLTLLALTPFSRAESQVEFVANLIDVVREGDASALLTLELTPDFTIEVLVTEDTEINDDDGTPLEIGDLSPGLGLRIRGIFVATGSGFPMIVARGVQVLDVRDGFTLEGPLDEVGNGFVRLLGTGARVTDETRIIDTSGEPIRLEDLSPGQRVNVKGAEVDDVLVARLIKRLQRRHFARVKLEGIVTELRDDGHMTVAVGGGVSLVVQLSPDTEIRGQLAVGVAVEVSGVLNPDLSVLALRVKVRTLIHLAPNALRMKTNSVRRVQVVLRRPLDTDLFFSISSRNPDIATTDPTGVRIPAGEFSTHFEVHAGPTEGATQIILVRTLPTAVAPSGNTDTVPDNALVLPVRVEDDEEEERELEVRWSPRKIESAPQGVRRVSIRLNRSSPRDTPVRIRLAEGDEGFVRFPERVLIPAGEKGVRFEIEFTARSGKAKLEAMLPEDVGGDKDTLEIAIRPPNTDVGGSDNDS